MRRFLLRGWPGTCLLVSLLTCGCQHKQCCCSPCTAPTAVAMSAPVAVPASAAPAVDAPTPSGQPGSPPVVHTAAKPALAPNASAQAVPRPSLPESDPDRTALSRPRFAHDPNYRWLVGALEYSRIQQAWLLRYVSFEEEDRYGGCVTLVMSSRPTNFKPGQVVRVEGALIDPGSQQLRPAFEVQKIRAE